MITQLRCFAILAGLFALVATSACKDENKEKVEKTFAPICERSTETLADSSDLDADTFKQVLENALKSCSAACDGDHGESCVALDGHIEKLCKVMPDACSSFCKDAKGSLKKAACTHEKKS